MVLASEVVQAFHSGVLFSDKQGRRIVAMYDYSCGPARIDGLEDDETVAILVEGESEEDGLTLCDHRDLRRG